MEITPCLNKILRKGQPLGHPSWYRGVASFQLAAADQLLFALRDDSEQKTTHRVRGCLRAIGIQPEVDIAGIKLIMRLSRNNDMAFLWFLMEIHYKTSDKQKYNVNEQLIMTLIAHLDMVTTLRELDRLLPQPTPVKSHNKKKPQEMRIQATKEQHAKHLPYFDRLIKKQHYVRPTQLAKPMAHTPYFNDMIDKQPNVHPIHPEKPMVLLPYFNRLIRKKPYISPPKAKKPAVVFKYSDYRQYTDPNYVVYNEKSRWFADFQINPVNKVIYRIINEEIHQIFNWIEYNPIAIRNIKKQQNLCSHHRTIECRKRKQKLEFKVDEYKRCIDYLNPIEARIKKAKECCKAQLENEIALKTLHLRKPEVKSIRAIVLQGDCKSNLRVIRSNEFAESAETKNIKCFSLQTEEKENKRHWKQQQRKRRDAMPCKPPRLMLLDERGCGDTACFERQTGGQQQAMVKSQESVPVKKCCSEKRDESKYELGYTKPSSPTKYFKGPRSHRPHMFNYGRIYNFKKDPYKPEWNVRDACIDALETDRFLLKKVPEDRQLSEAVNISAKNYWRKHSMAKFTEFNENRVICEKTPINPDDLPLMNRLLCDALQIMRKNKKFVLPTLPEAEKHPILVEWVRRRYGKVYSAVEREKENNATNQILTAVINVGLPVTPPTTRSFTNRIYVDYSCRDYLLTRTNQVIQYFNKHLQDAIMEYARTIWLAMPQYNEEFGKTYFAYMPANVRGLTVFRPWRSYEHKYRRK